MTEPRTVRSLPLGPWLAGLPDESLVRLLEVRPDLAQPAPGSMAALAARAVSRQSIKAAADELNFLHLALLDALLVLGADREAIPVEMLIALVGDRAEPDAVSDALAELRGRVLLWGDDQVRVSTEAAAALPWYPGQGIGEDGARSAAELRRTLDDLDETAREVLDRLAAGSPVGRTRDAAPGTPPDRPVQRLLAAGLLRPLDIDTVVLPRDVGQVLRGEQPGPAGPAAPDPVVARTGVGDVDASAAGAVLELIRQVEVVLGHLSETPVAELRSGGLGVREAKRPSKFTGID
ncbi:MAG: DNA-binding protein, partial [Mycobacterium sp.]|nr:DNA-binding protein [Mycobacterium sp.]